MAAKSIFTPSEELYFQRLWQPVHQFISKGMRVLDAGCGDGKIAFTLATAFGCRATGIDIQTQPIWQQLKAPGLVYQAASAEQLPFADASFDAAWVKDALHHMEHPEKALAEIQRVVIPGGPIIVIEANRYNPVFYIHLTLLGPHQHFTRKRFQQMLMAADPDYFYTMAESRNLPWNASWILWVLRVFEDLLEKAAIFNPWLTYQIGVIKGRGQSAG